MPNQTNALQPLNVHLISCGGWWLPKVAVAFHERRKLGGLWISDNDRTNISRELVHRCWRFQIGMQPFFRFTSQIVIEKAFYALFPLWKSWVKKINIEHANVVQAIIGYATEPFNVADKTGALKVVDCPNSHPVTYYGNWQRECDIWCPGDTVPIPQWMFARMNRELERADMVIVQSKYCKQTMVQNGIPEEKIMVNPMGVDTSIFKKRETVPDKPRFVCVATICLRKGHQYLFRAFEHVKKKLPDAELICVGSYKSDFRRERPKWDGSFTHIEALSHPELAKLLQTCTAFVFPSQEEGIARAQMEALACGLPVVGTHEGGTTTVVEDGVEGFIVPGRSPEHIAEAMVKIATNKELNQKLSDAAYLHGGLNNTWQDYGDRLIAEYERRLGRH